MKYDRNVFAQNIKMIMDAKRITQGQLADAIGSEQPTISKRLNGNGDFTLSQAVEIAAFLKSPIDALLSEDKKEIHPNVVTVSDALSMLFRISEATPIRICTIEDAEAKAEGLDKSVYSTTTIEFTNPTLSNVISTFGKLLDLAENEKAVGEALISWQEKILDEFDNVLLDRERISKLGKDLVEKLFETKCTVDDCGALARLEYALHGEETLAALDDYLKVNMLDDSRRDKVITLKKKLQEESVFEAMGIERLPFGDD